MTDSNIILFEWEHNNCFMIAAMQCIFNLEHAVDHFMESLQHLRKLQIYDAEEYKQFEDSVIRNVAVVVKFIRENSVKMDVETLNIRKLLKSICTNDIGSQIVYGRGGDTKSFLFKFISGIEEEVKKFNEIVERKGYEAKVGKMSEFGYFYGSYMLIYDPCPSCNFKYEDETSKFSFLLLGGNATCIKEALKDNLSDGVSWCSGCNNNKCTYHKCYNQFPQYLFCQLRRGGIPKLPKLTIEKDFEMDCYGGEKYKLKLLGVALDGTGHTTALIRKDDKWYYCDEIRYHRTIDVTKSVDDQYLTVKENAIPYQGYILFYNCYQLMNDN